MRLPVAPRRVGRAVERDRAGRRREHAGEQVEQRGLAGAVRARRAGRLPGSSVRSSVAKDVAPARIAERQIARSRSSAPCAARAWRSRRRDRRRTRRFTPRSLRSTSRAGGRAGCRSARRRSLRRDRKPAPSSRLPGSSCSSAVSMPIAAIVRAREAMQREQHLLAAGQRRRLARREGCEIERRECRRAPACGTA